MVYSSLYRIWYKFLSFSKIIIFFLLSSILLESLSTACLKKTIKNNLWFIPVYTGYGISFYLFPKSLSKFSLNYAYSIWCGTGMIITLLVDVFIYKQIVNIQQIIGLIIIIFGIKVSS